VTLISAVKTYIATYNGLEDDAGLFIELLGALPTQYALVPLPGPKIIETYIDGSSLRQYQFALQSMESTADDPARIANNEFYEAFADWLESQTEAGTLPSLGTGKTAESIEALGQPILFQLGDSGTGIYQLQCRLVYQQDAQS
jgi:hypothetical protein